MKKCFRFVLVLLASVFMMLPFIGCKMSEEILSSIYISQMPSQVSYDYEDFLDLTGLVVTAKYSNGSKKTIDSWTSSPKPGTKLTTPGKVNITISYQDKTTSFTVNVAEKPVVCNITYKTEYGTAPSKKTVSYNTKLTADDLPPLTSDSCTFGGWYIGSNKITEGYEVKKDITLTAKWLKECNVTYVTEYGEQPSPVKIMEGETLTEAQLPELTYGNYTIYFCGWYDGEKEVIVEDYIVTGDVTLTAKWSTNSLKLDDSSHVVYQMDNKTLIFDFSQYKNKDDLINQFDDDYNDYYDGVLTVNQLQNGTKEVKKIVFKGSVLDSHPIVFNDLCIKLEDWNSKATIVFEDIGLDSSKGQPLIYSPVDLLIEYKGENYLSSSAEEKIDLIKCDSDIEIKSVNNKSTLKLSLEENKVKNSTEGSVAIKAQNVSINGGTFTIIGGDGFNDGADYSGKSGGDGSSGIIADEITIMNNAIVDIKAGNGADGKQGVQGSQGQQGKPRDWIGVTKAEDGYKGGIGGKGGTGGNGGNAIVGNLIIEASADKVTLRGGKGGKGGTGGKGGKGGKGGTNNTSRGNPGNGGKGGTGGDGGNGGNGGNGLLGSVENHIDNNADFYAGNQGLGGDPGDGGDGGDRGTINQDAWMGKGDVSSPGATGEPGKNRGNDGKPGKGKTK